MAEALIYPEDLSDGLREILGMPNFVAGPFAHRFRDAGHDIPRKAEAEQAFIIHWLTRLCLAHPEDWREHANAELAALNSSDKRDSE